METKLEDAVNENSLDIAVIGMSCRFPKAKNTRQFWENLCNGVNTVSFFSDEELVKKGVSPELLKNPDYVKAGSVLYGIELFDAEFFGVNPNEARGMDPQQRIFLECCFEALEDAGYDAEAFDGDIGVFAGVAVNSYISEVLSRNDDFLKSASRDQIMIGNDKDFLPTLVSYKLNLKGPSVNINTACSTALVSIHMARQSLLLGESDMVLAGGVSIFPSSGKGYLYMKDGIQSPDGYCRAFDAEAKGTIFGDGCGVVLLKRLADAIEDCDNIYAVIKGTAVNNDGAAKAGYTAPGVEGQSRVIVEALAVSDISPEQINYVETHGTGTQLGDPIEIAALTQAYSSGTDRKNFCPIGSVKANIGHLNSAAGAAGFIKTVLAVKNKKLPPSINFEAPNPKIDFCDSPFYVNTELTDWKNGDQPLRAGISSMGIGGTNSHVIIEEFVPPVKKEKKNGLSEEQILILSARSEKALEDATDNMANYLEAHNELLLNDVAYTLQCGRRAFSHRRGLLCSSIKEAVEILQSRDDKRLFDSKSFKDIQDNSIKSPELIKWLKGERVDWTSIWQDTPCSRVPLPTYPFESKYFWVEPKALDSILQDSSNNSDDQYYNKFRDMADWFYISTWKQSYLPFTERKGGSKTRLIFADDFNIGRSVMQKLEEEGDNIIVAAVGKSYMQNDESSFVLNPSEEGDYKRMLEVLKASDRLPDSILFFWSLEKISETKAELELELISASQEHGFFSMLNLIKALDGLAVGKQTEFIVFTNNVFDILGNEELCISASTVHGMCLVIQQAYENFPCRIVDILLPEDRTDGFAKTVEALKDEITSEAVDIECAYRGNKRYVREYDPLRIEADAPRYNVPHKDGVYLVFSGLEGIGLLVSEHIAQNIGGKILILEEEGFPEKENWGKWLEEMGDESPISAKIKNAEKLILDNAEYIGTISDLKENAQLLEELENRVGKINGIIHAPGASNAKRIRTIKSSTPETWLGNFKVVCYSMMVLDQIFGDRHLDFRIMMSSLGAVLGGPSFINISTVSNYVNAYIIKQSRNSKEHWIEQNWTSWIIEWKQIGDFFPRAMYKRLEPSILTDEEGIKCFERIFAVKNITGIAISGTDLGKRYNRWVNINSSHKQEAEEKPAALMSRPELDTAYAAPESEMEKAIHDIFSELLGIGGIGVNDNFFELGGHSLLGVQLTSKVRKICPMDLDLYCFINNPTIASLASYLESINVKKQ